MERRKVSKIGSEPRPFWPIEPGRLGRNGKPVGYTHGIVETKHTIYVHLSFYWIFYYAVQGNNVTFSPWSLLIRESFYVLILRMIAY